MRSENEVNQAIEIYSDMIMRIAMTHMKNMQDTEDIFQEVFLKYVKSDAIFESKEHEKAWFIRVTMNLCKDSLKSFFRKNMLPIDDYVSTFPNITNSNKEVLSAVLSLPDKYRDVIYLYYYEGYAIKEIAQLLHKNVNTIYTLLNRAKPLLKEKIGGDEDE